MDRDLIEPYAAGGEKLAMAIRGLKREDLMWVPPPDAGVGRWSIQQLVVHLADSDLVGTDRMKRVIAEDNPPLIAFDENKWTERLHYEEQDAEEAAKLFELNRKAMVRVLRKLPDAAFERRGTHSERGPLTLAQIVRMMTGHLDHHLKFVTDKREKMGKIMW